MKRLLYIDHSFHVKTKSTQCLISLLADHYTVDVFWDKAWKGGRGITPEEVNSKDYYAIVFVQELPPFEFRQIRCKNLVYVPMFDGVSLSDASFWRSLKPAKILSFCRVLDDAVAAEDLSHLYVQYFPEPMPTESLNGRDRGLFFWPRTDRLGWETVRTLIGDNEVGSVHLHMAADPGCELEKPNPADIESFRMTFSNWFGSREEYLQVLSRYSLFVAPRLKEGIGMSFLEAMALGRAVIAANSPTMNEYITDGVTGYFFDPARPSKLALGGSAAVGRNALEYASAGWKNWNREKYRILDFIEAPPPVSSGRTLPRRTQKKASWRAVLRALVPPALKKQIKLLRRPRGQHS
jgi:glycosyltransferase involved in cell wall biosynthesis